ncbi:hypothetical protein ACF08M_13715 [Streptomyces sp. NPDC015032]|uniref:hypothetical protein n=1 Tax=Streptomyces sp. NPDC015032 TaxID=3364937 RepID=UPI0037001A62
MTPPSPRRLADDAMVEADPRCDVRWVPLGTADTAGTACAANGHAVASAATPRGLPRLLDPLRSGKPVVVADLLTGFRPAGTDGLADTVRLPALAGKVCGGCWSNWRAFAA